MPRRREVPKREAPADPIYGSPLVTKFISTIMKDGKLVYMMERRDIESRTADMIAAELQQALDTHC